MHEILANIETMLRDYEFVREANDVASALSQFSIDPEIACELLISDQWWIGEDAVAEIDLSIAGGFSPQARQDQQRFQQLIVRLYELLVEKGYENDVAKLVVTQYQKWQVSGM